MAKIADFFIFWAKIPSFIKIEHKFSQKWPKMIKIDVFVKDKNWKRYLPNPRRYLNNQAKKINLRNYLNPKSINISVLLTGNNGIRILNRKFNLKIPVILFHGTNDKVVPLSFSQKILKIFKKAKKKLVKIKNGDHSLSRRIATRIIIWIRRFNINQYERGCLFKIKN